MKQKLTERNCASLAKNRDPTLQTIWTTLTGVAAKVGGLSTKGFDLFSKINLSSSLTFVRKAIKKMRQDFMLNLSELTEYSFFILV
jgi:hypothetical protein